MGRVCSSGLLAAAAASIAVLYHEDEDGNDDDDDVFVFDRGCNGESGHFLRSKWKAESYRDGKAKHLYYKFFLSSFSVCRTEQPAHTSFFL